MVAEGRRAPIPPARLRHELARTSLTALLAHRFDTAVTMLQAGAGFGKTTAIAQAIRANQIEPFGIDAWVACEATDEDPSRFASTIVAAIEHATSGPPDPRPDRHPNGARPLDHVLSAVHAAAPLDVCIVLDDVHVVRPGTGGHQLLVDLVKQLPGTCHLVLASRSNVGVPVARLRAAGQVVEIDESLLAFAPHEVRALADLHGTDAARAAHVAGWPSLVQLALTARRGAAIEFLWEEVVGALSPIDRVGLLALVTLGWGSSSELDDVAGADIDVRRLLDIVPLTYSDGKDRVGIHPLWETTIERVFSPGERRDVRRRALTTMDGAGDIIRLGSAAVRWGDDRWLRHAALELVADSWGGLPLGIAQGWIDQAPATTRRSPELRLLAMAVRHHLDPHDCDVEAELDELVDDFGRAGRVDGQVRAIALGSVVAHERNDSLRLFQLAGRARTLAGSERVPALRFLIGSVDAALASMRGDIDEALAIIDTLPVDSVPPQSTRLTTRLRSMLLMLSGRADEAVDDAARLIDVGDELAADLLSFLRWQAGQPDDFLSRPLEFDPSKIAGCTDRLVYAAEIVAIAAGLGKRDVLDQATAWLSGAAVEDLDARCSAFVSVAGACAAIVAGDEAAASRTLAEHLERHRDAAKVAELHLRRHPAIGYVCNSGLRSWWDRTPLGPSHQTSIDAARALLRVRSGELAPTDDLPDVSVAVTSLPLPWSIELGATAHALGHPGGGALVDALIDRLGEAAILCLRRLGADDLIDRGQQRSAGCLQVDVLGPMRVSIADVAFDSPDLRRGRVRTLLALLAVRGAMRRDEVIEMMWPDADPDRGRQNLRVTLSRLRRALDPASDGRRCLITEDDRISLAGPPILDVDLWQFRGVLATARRSRPAAAPTTAELEAAVELWRDEPLNDLESIIGAEPDIEFVRQELVDASLRLGEAFHVEGRFDDAARCAERVRSTAPYAERAHRLAIAAQLQRRDRTRLASAVRLATEMFDDLGVRPEESTLMLLRRSAAIIGTHHRLPDGPSARAGSVSRGSPGGRVGSSTTR